MAKKIDITSRAACKVIREEMEAVLATLDLGVHFEVGRMTYGANGITAKVTVSHIGDDGTAMTPDRQAFIDCATRLGLVASDLDREFIDHTGDTWKVVGMKPKSHKYPILVENARGKVFKFPADRVRVGLLREVTA